jgi:hypothetical protein
MKVQLNKYFEGYFSDYCAWYSMAEIKKLFLFNHFISVEKENSGERWSKMGTPLQSNGWFGKAQECQKFPPS